MSFEDFSSFLYTNQDIMLNNILIREPSKETRSAGESNVKTSSSLNNVIEFRFCFLILSYKCVGELWVLKFYWLIEQNKSDCHELGGDLGDLVNVLSQAKEDIWAIEIFSSWQLQ